MLHSVAFGNATEEDVLSPILVRPVREQLEHDRVIRLLQIRYKRKFTVGLNVGSEQTAPVGAGADALYPDLVLTTPASGRKLLGVVEVETAESVNQLEAMAQWVRLGRLPVEFALYVPASAATVARRLCADLNVGVTELWTFHPLGDQLRFTQIQRSPVAGKLQAARAAAAAARKAAAAQVGDAAPRRKRTADKKAPSAKREKAPRAKPARPRSASRLVAKKR